jgi:hypothetical protein
MIARPAMPNDLSIQAAALVNTASSDSAAPVKSNATAASVEATAPSPNPALELDAALGLVVIEFRNGAGTVTSSIPTQQQLDAYQLWQESGVGPAPSLGPSTPVAVAGTPARSDASGRSTVLGVGD